MLARLRPRDVALIGLAGPVSRRGDAALAVAHFDAVSLGTTSPAAWGLLIREPPRMSGPAGASDVAETGPSVGEWGARSTA
jgi:hypothetical protein